jgi:hypothetical protein
VCAVVADVSDIKQNAARELSLNAQEEALHVAGFEVGIDVAGGDVERIEYAGLVRMFE